jgi:hypothetical protein
VEVHRCLSREPSGGWTDPIRLLWIDGDHTYAGALADLELFRRHLVHGVVVAFHGALSPLEGPIRVFVEEVLRGDQFGPAGFVGSIAWAQYLPGSPSSGRHAERRRLLAKRAARLIPFISQPRRLGRLERIRFRLLRSRIPHGAVRTARWLEQIERPG